MRKRDVLTLGLSAPSRWNPLYRRWARRRALDAVTLALKALTARYGVEQDDAGTYALVVHADELALADRYAGSVARSDDGKSIRLRVELAPGPHRFRVLWGRRG